MQNLIWDRLHHEIDTSNMHLCINIISWSYKFTFFISDDYRQSFNISRTSVGNKFFDDSDAVGASPVGAAPTISSFSI